MSLSRETFLKRLEQSNRSGLLLQRAKREPVTGGLVIETVQDVEPILDANKALQVHGSAGPRSQVFRRVASVPNIVIHQWIKKGINPYSREDWPKIKRLLNDSENLHLRTTTERL